MAYTQIIDIKDILNTYSSEVNEELYDIAKQVAKECVEDVKASSPVNVKHTSHRGSYKKGWRMDIEKGYGTVEATIYNKTDYQLTHLLERPHLNRTGTRKVIPKSEGHISRAEQTAIKEFERKLEMRLKNG